MKTVSLSWGKGKKALSAFACLAADVHYRINEVPSASFTLVAVAAVAGKLSAAIEQELPLLMPGQPVTLSVDKEVLFSGLVTRQESHFSAGEQTVTVQAHHLMQSAKALYRSQVFSQQSDSDILRTLFQAHGVALGKVDGIRWKHPQMVQFNCSDWRFIQARLHATGVWLVTTPQAVSVMQPALGSAGRQLKAGDTTLYTVTFYRSNTGLPEKLEVSSWDIANQRMHRASMALVPQVGADALAAGAFKPLSAQTWRQGLSLDLLPDEQQALAGSHLLSGHVTSLQADIAVAGDLRWQVGQTLGISGFGKGLDGLALISGVKHRIEPEAHQWTTQLEVGADPLHHLNSALVPGICGLHIGVVGENLDGPDNHHSIKITLPALLSDKTPLLARLGAPYASEESGFNFYPEAGDEVIVGFFEDDPRYPVILGSMHNPKRAAPTAALNKGKGLVLKTREWIQRLILHPTQGLLLEEKNGSQLSSLVMKAGQVTVQTSDDFHLSAQKVLQMTGKDLSLSAQKALQLASQDALEASGANSVTLTGKKVDIKQ